MDIKINDMIEYRNEILGMRYGIIQHIGILEDFGHSKALWAYFENSIEKALKHKGRFNGTNELELKTIGSDQATIRIVNIEWNEEENI